MESVEKLLNIQHDYMCRTYLSSDNNEFLHLLNLILEIYKSFSESMIHLLNFYPAALKGSGVLSYPERAGGWAGGRADKLR